MRVAAVLLAVTFVAGTLAAVVLRDLRLAEGLTLMVVGLGFVLAGILASTRRPADLSGRLLTLAGLIWLLAVAVSTVGNPVAQALAMALAPLGLAPLAHMVVAYPGGHLKSRAERVVVAAVYGLAVASLPIAGPGACSDCTPRPAGLEIDRGFGRVWYSSLLVAVLLTTVGVIVVLARRWKDASPVARRILLPVLPGACFFAAVYAGAILSELGVPTGLGERWALVGLVLVGVAPLVFLGGLLRSWLARGGVGRLVVELGDSPPSHVLRDALADALGDPCLKLAYWLPERGGYVEAGGSPMVLPPDGEGRACAVIERRGHRVGAIVYDAALHDDPGLVDAVAAAAGLAMENERLHAEVLARLEDVKASRARIVQAADTARRRVERDLHDGAQQRLVSVALSVGLARSRLDAGQDPELGRLLRRASEDAASALAELRELAQGLHPQVLAEAGLGAALQSLVDRCSVPVDLTVGASGDSRLPADVEAAAYFVVSEALANVAKHAQASAVEVRVDRRGERLLLEVVDDGVGGAAVRPGSGLEGLADRVAALDGRLDVDSPSGQGTSVRVELPCG